MSRCTACCAGRDGAVAGFRTGKDGKLVQEKLHYDGKCVNALFLYVKTSKVGDKVRAPPWSLT